MRNTCYNLPMDENLAWKIVYAAALFSLFILGIAYYLMSPQDPAPLEEDKLNRSAEFRQATVAGRQDGQKVWEFAAGSGWTEKRSQRTNLFDVSSGQVYSGGRLVIADLVAPRAYAGRNADFVEASGPLTARLDLKRLSSARDRGHWSKLFADHIKYLPAEKRSEITGKVTLIMKDGVIRAGRIDVDHGKKTALITDDVRVRRANGLIRTASLEYWADPERADVPVRLSLDLKENRVSTRIKAGRGTFFMDINKDISLAGGVEVLQGKKAAVAASGVYSRRQDRLRLLGGTRTVLEKAAALLKPDTAAKLRRPDAREMLKQKTVVTADEMVFSTRTGDARAAGHVVVTQKGKEAKADAAAYDDKRETLRLSGNVFLKKGADWLSCRQVIISIGRETFEALGVKEAQFKL